MRISRDYVVLSVMGVVLPVMMSVHCILTGAELVQVTRWCQYWILMAISFLTEITVLHKVRLKVKIVTDHPNFSLTDSLLRLSGSCLWDGC